MTFNRERFQAAKLEVNKKISDEVEKTFKSNSTRGDYHTIDEGSNYFRMMPPHNPEDPSMQAKVVYWLDCKVEEIKDDKPTGKYIIKPRPIFDSRVHGGTPKDIVDEYINFTKKSIYSSVQDKDERLKLLAPINGWRDRSGKWNPGILPNQSFVCYATKGEIIPENIGRLELWKKDKETLEKLNISEATDEPIMTDFFSDPNEGVQFIITKKRDDKGAFFTIIQKNSFNPKGAKDINNAYQEWLSSQIVSDEVLQKLEEMEPLSKQFKNVYKKSDFDRALEALMIFDEKYGYGTFENDEFNKIVEEIASYYSKGKEEEKFEKETGVSVTKITKKSLEKKFTLEDMNRDQLKAYIKEKGYPIRVLNSMNEDIIREMISEIEEEDSDKELEKDSSRNYISSTEDFVERNETKYNIKPNNDFDQEDLKKEVEEVFEKNPVQESLKERLARLRKENNKE